MKNKLHISKTVKLAFTVLFFIVLIILHLLIPKLQGFEVTAEALETTEATVAVWYCGLILLFVYVTELCLALVNRLLRKYRRLKHPEKPLTMREQAQDLRDLPDEKLVALVKQKKPMDPMASILSGMLSSLTRSMSDLVPPRSDEGGDPDA